MKNLIGTSTKKLQKILFVHSAGPQYGKGKGSYDLVNYLRSKLSADFKILFPKIEKPNAPEYRKYKSMLSSSFVNIKDPIVLIGHSLGGSTLLKYLSEEKPDVTIAAIFLVSTPHWTSNMKKFVLKDNFEKSLKNVPVFLYHSKKDEIIPFDHLDFYKKAFTNATVRELPGKDHVFSKGLPELVSDIQNLEK